MPASPPTETNGEARVRCLYCGANNFPASATCWQCGRPLQAAPSVISPAAAPTPAPGVVSAPLSPAPLPVGESALAPKAAAALGLMFPYIGLPVGMVFLMLDDPRKTQLGWLTIGWSVLGSILNGIALLATLAPLWGLLKAAHPSVPTGIPGVPNLSGDGTELFRSWLLTLPFSAL